MGLVKVDVRKAERQFELINFSDVNCIAGLIKHRSIIDSYMDSEVNRNIYSSGDVLPMNAELIVTYITLDQLLEKSKLKDKQKQIITMLMQGYSIQDIADEFKQDASGISRTFDMICLRIKEINDMEWKYDNMYLNKKRVEWNYKQCNRCGEFKAQLPEFFGTLKSSKDGFRNICKVCR